MSANKRRDIALTFAVASILAMIVAGLHGNAIGGWWRFDDSLVLAYVVENPAPAIYFFSPQDWRLLGVPFFTPWLALDFWLDFVLFGHEPAAFYLHHLVMVWLAALLTFVLLRRFAGPIWSAVGAITFLLGSPTFIVSQQLMSRHYVVGLVFAILALLSWLNARETGRKCHDALALACYLAALLNKEVFLLLPLVLFALDERGVRERMLAITPMFATAVVFVLWRWLMLGKLVGGHSDSLHEVGSIISSFAQLPGVFFGQGERAFLGMVILLAALYRVLRFGGTSRVIVPAAVVALAAPFLAVRIITDTDLRFALIPWWGVCVLLGLGLKSRVTGTIPSQARWQPYVPVAISTIGISVFCLVAVAKGTSSAQAYGENTAAFDVQGRFYWDHDSSVAYVPYGSLSAYLHIQYASHVLKTRLLGQSAPRSAPFPESARLLLGPVPLYMFDPECRCMKAVRSESASRPSTANILPQKIQIERHAGNLSWTLATRSDDRCFMRFDSWNAAFALPCAGDLPFDLPYVQGQFHLLIRAATGAWAATPLLAFPGPSGKMTWTNPAGSD